MVSTRVGPEVEKVNSVSTATKIVLILEYNGANYYGFQLQAGQPTIQGELEKAIAKLTGERTRVLGASRTDTGVHAMGQVVSFRTWSSLPVKAFINGMNYYLPADIAVRTAHKVNDSVNVRRQAISREYRYSILNRQTRSPLRDEFSYLVSGRLNIEDMNEASKALLGEHDFASFTSDMGLKSTVRRVYRAETKREEDCVVYTMVANSFLSHQVRATVGSLIRVGLGKMSASHFYDIIEAKKPGLAGPVAPPSGLCLVKVNYSRPFEEYNDENVYD
ncbi:MAG: tRNA pseudouridine(38-40) synthase TruA [Chloroflexota bacterium]